MGPLLGVNPFGQPNVAAAKAATAAVLEGEISAPAAQSTVDGVSVTFAGALAAPSHAERTIGTAVGHAVACIESGDFLCVLAYLPDDECLLAPLVSVIPPAAAELGVPITLELGPRLHSPANCIWVAPISAFCARLSDSADVPAPVALGLRALHRAQSGGLVILLSGRRCVLRSTRRMRRRSLRALVRGR
jgi:glucose-6-phosphate isomerase